MAPRKTIFIAKPGETSPERRKKLGRLKSIETEETCQTILYFVSVACADYTKHIRLNICKKKKKDK